jgi:apolipoprotein D and lipocalin family protein
MPIATAQSVDLDRYQGRWFEIARYPNSFERGCDGVTADYGARPDGLVFVRNTCQRGDSVNVAEGYARVVPGSSNAKLRVSFAPEWVSFAEGDYWILFVEENYQTALVGSPSGRRLWILARTPMIDTTTRNRLEAVARSNGFDPAMLENTMQAPR